MIENHFLHEKVVESIGPYKVLKNHRAGSNRTGVWEIRRKSDNKNYFVKSYYRKSRWHPEVFAYRNWIPSIYPFAPNLICTIDEGETYAIIISSLGGMTVREAEHLNELQLQKIYFLVGELTSTMHKTFLGRYFGRPDNEGNPIEIYCHNDPVVYFQESIHNSIHKGAEMGIYTEHEIKLSEWALRNAGMFKGTKPRAVSWDSSPNNWIVNDKGEFVGLIDFENMLWGFEEDNFFILYERYFPNYPKVEIAYFKGYGENVPTDRADHIKAICIKAAISSILWGETVKDERSIRLAHGLLSTIRI